MINRHRTTTPGVEDDGEYGRDVDKNSDIDNAAGEVHAIENKNLSMFFGAVKNHHASHDGPDFVAYKISYVLPST